jgi:ubiquinone/menaquinone biosynthesis C-methylase UbiE
MSSYENYSEVSKHYDQTRVPIGAEILIGALTLLRRSCSHIRLLDAGCGTGAYAELALPYIDRIDAMDINPGMLAVAREKLADAASESRIAFHQDSVHKLPFAAECFDVVTFNQVLHHLETGQDGCFAGHRNALAEAHRVLRPGGLLVVNCTNHEQLHRGYWYMHLIPTALSALYNRCIPSEKLKAMLGDVGFTFENRFVPLDGVLQGAAYFQASGPLEQQWRNAESSWALAPENEITAAVAKLQKLRGNGGLDAYMAEHDGKRRQVGQTTFFMARKI